MTLPGIPLPTGALLCLALSLDLATRVSEILYLLLPHSSLFPMVGLFPPGVFLSSTIETSFL